MAFDVTALRAQLPSLESGTAHFDGPGGTQTPRAVGQAIADTLTGPLSNRGADIRAAQLADQTVAAFRAAYADLLGADPRGVVYGRSATQLTYDFSRHLTRDWGPGDEVVVSRLDHDANVRPWLQATERTGATPRWIDFDPQTAEIDLDSVTAAVTDRTRLVAITGASNVLGTRPPVRQISDLAHRFGAKVWVDGVHHAAHSIVDLGALGADFFVCSPYKFLGPHCAVLAAAPELLESIRPDKLAPSTDTVPERFELGTLPYEIMAGATAAVEVLAGLAPDDHADRRDRLLASAAATEAHETRLRQRIETGLAELGEQVTQHSRAADRTPTLLVTFDGRPAVEVYRFLAARNVFAPAGSFYAYEPFRRLRLPDHSALRIGLAPYNDDSDVDRLLTGLADAIAG